MSRYIDAEKLKSILRPMEWGTSDERWVPEHEIANMLDFFPAADVVEVVRCRECVMWDGSFTLNGLKKCLNMTFCTDGDFYCGWGTKK